MPLWEGETDRDNAFPKGAILLDVTYQQVNHMTKKQRREIMREEYPLLQNRLPDAPVMVGMVVVLEALQDLPVDDGYALLNSDGRIPFPANGQQRRFHDLAREALAIG